ncbi:MAG TPA: DNA polymerase III subunit delta [Solirubrobacteraceae bacterium]|nr:DNA polymerase III subunit delta [Solirubrobacteraceae bacterium]
MPPAWKPAYLIHGDDHGRIAERRGRLRAIAEQQSGANGAELLEGDESTPEATAMALSAMTFAMGRRFVIVDGVEKWKEAEVKQHLVPVLKQLDPETTVSFFGREEGRAKVPKALIDAVKAAGGDISTEATLKARELPRWVQAQAQRLGVQIDNTAAQALVAAVGERQQRLLRELEKLALEHGHGAAIGIEEVEAVAAHSAERQVWSLVDALVARDRETATRWYVELRAQGESLARLVPLVARRLREVLMIAERIEAGEPLGKIKPTLKMSPWAADRRIAEARKANVDDLRHALVALADLELASRGGSELDDDTVALRTIDAIAA